MAAAAVSGEVEQPPSLESGASNHENADKERAKPAVAPVDINAANSARSGGPKTPSGPSRSNTFRTEKDKKIGHRRIDPGGQVTYKKIQTTQIMSSIQLGISNAIGSLASKPERDLLMQDFFVVETVYFSKEGSSHTPAHHYSDFRFKTYSPIAFRYFRLLFGIEPDDFLMSLCDEPLIELGNPGASGSIFYLTQDDEFIIKTVQHKEGEFLQKLLPGYYMNLNQNPRTLLPKFFGLYCYQCNQKNVRLVAMNNLLPSSVKIHYKYDLKGSTYKRKANKHEKNKGCPTFKDLDFVEHNPDGIMLESETYTALINTLHRDCRVLESFKIMDYSMLVGVHNMDQAAKEHQEALQRQNSEEGGTSTGEVAVNSATGLTRSRSITRQRLVAHSTAMESIQAQSEPIDEPDDVPSGGIPARNGKGERLLLFIGIIDILQSYRLKKKLEHTWKSMIHDGDTVSVHRPGFYAQRFQNFMANKVFRKIPSRFGGRPPTSTPPPGFEEAVRESIEGPQSTTSPRVRLLRGEVMRHESEPVSITQITLESRSALSVHSESSSSTSGFGSTVRTSTLTWTPPMSVEGSTPTWTEGTPSYTDSSSSGDPAYPSTPVRSRESDPTKYSSGQHLDDESLEAAEVVRC